MPSQTSPAGRQTAPARAQRADARRNVAAILEAAEACLVRDPGATMAGIARAAGVGRMTLYGHFPARADLVDAVFEEVTQRANAVLDDVDVTGDPRAALRALVGSSWGVVHRFRAVLAAAEKELDPERIREHHDRHEDRLTELLGHGRRVGAFRTDVPVEWLVAVCTSLMHAAAAEVMAGRLDGAEAERVVVSTIESACATPSSPG